MFAKVPHLEYPVYKGLVNLPGALSCKDIAQPCFLSELSTNTATIMGAK